MSWLKLIEWIICCEWIWLKIHRGQCHPWTSAEQLTTKITRNPFSSDINMEDNKNVEKELTSQESAFRKICLISMLCPFPNQQLIELILTQGRAVCAGRWFVACQSEWHQGGSSSHKTDLWGAQQSSVSIDEIDYRETWAWKTLVALMKYLTTNKWVSVHFKKIK